MTKFAKLLIKIWAITAWKDGNGISFYWNWWHPVSWVLAPVSFILNCLLVGIPETIEYSYELGFGVSPYWKDKDKEYL